MPELPEVETTLRGIKPWLLNQEITRIEVREPRMRWPVTSEVQQAVGQKVATLRRRAKYIVAELEHGGLMLHLGMSGSVRVLTQPEKPGKHDHFDIVTRDAIIRYHDPRRFGAFLWWQPPLALHPLLKHLGPEPLSKHFHGDHLWRESQGRKLAVKNFIMDGKIVAGVGNIYASEALFMAGIHPTRPAGRVSCKRYANLAEAIRDVLLRAIEQGGTTLRDFVGSSGSPGYFAQDLLVYGRTDGACFQCGSEIRQKVIGQRSSYYCVNCQR